MKRQSTLLLLCSLFLMANVSFAQENSNKERQLTTGVPIEREIVGGQAHTYRVALQQGQFLRAVVDSHDIVVVATLIGPGDEKLLTVDLLKYPAPEPVSFTVAKEGVYRLEVRAAGVAAVTGRYVLTSEVKASASATDKDRQTAEQLLIEANALESQGSKESLQKSIDKRGEALVLWRKLGDRYWEAYKNEEYSSLRSRGDPKSEVGYSSPEAEAVKVLDQVGELGREQDRLRDQKDKKVLDQHGQQRLDQIERELMPKVNAEFRRALAAIEKEAPETVVKTAEVKEAQSLMRYLRELGAGTVALYTVVSTEEGKSSKGWVILVTPDFQRAYEMDVADLDQTVAAFRQTLRSPIYDPQPLAQKLYRMIFLKQQKQGQTLAADLEAYLRGQKEKTLMWSLDGVLRYVPMAALHDGERYLVERYRNVVFTPASLPGLTHAPSREWKALGLGVAKKYEGFTALSGVPKELSAIVQDNQKHTGGVLPGTIKWDAEFKEKAMMDGLSEGYNVVHIASHFSYQAANPERSFLLLGDGGHLEMSKIQDLTSLFGQTDLVTLSACDTAVGSAMKDANGKDVEGFAYITQKLGALAVIATLWPVDDVGTQTLMPKFYSLHKTGLSKAEALRQAQLSLLNGSNRENGPEATTQQRSTERINDGSSQAPGLPFKLDPNAKYGHPYYWAPFILIGNWK